MRLTTLLFLALFTVGILWAKPMHPFHSSLTEIRYNAVSHSWEISVRLFADDLEKALIPLNKGQRVSLGKSDISAAWIEKYLALHFIISEGVGDKPVYIGHEFEADAIWVYLELPCTACSRLSLVNTLLTEIFSNQANIVNVIKDKSKKSFLFKKGTEKAEFN